MTDEAEMDVDQVLEEYVKLSEETTDDKRRFDALLRKQTLNNASALAGEVVQTIVPTLGNALELSAQLFSAHQDSIFDLEEAVYQQNQKAVSALLDLLTNKSIINTVEHAKVLAMFAVQQTDSILSAQDSAMILEQLENFQALMGESDPESEKLRATIERVKEISMADDGADEEEPEAAIEANGASVEAHP